MAPRRTSPFPRAKMTAGGTTASRHLRVPFSGRRRKIPRSRNRHRSTVGFYESDDDGSPRRGTNPSERRTREVAPSLGHRRMESGSADSRERKSRSSTTTRIGASSASSSSVVPKVHLFKVAGEATVIRVNGRRRRKGPGARRGLIPRS